MRFGLVLVVGTLTGCHTPDQPQRRMELLAVEEPGPGCFAERVSSSERMAVPIQRNVDLRTVEVRFGRAVWVERHSDGDKNSEPKLALNIGEYQAEFSEREGSAYQLQADGIILQCGHASGSAQKTEFACVSVVGDLGSSNVDVTLGSDTELNVQTHHGVPFAVEALSEEKENPAQWVLRVGDAIAAVFQPTGKPAALFIANTGLKCAAVEGKREL